MKRKGEEKKRTQEQLQVFYLIEWLDGGTIHRAEEVLGL